MLKKPTDKVFTSGEVASICGVSADTVSRWFDLGQIEGYRLGAGGDRRIPYANLRKFMLSHGIPLERLEEDEQRILVVDDDPYYLDVIPSILAKVDRDRIMELDPVGRVPAGGILPPGMFGYSPDRKAL
ncbi:MAG: helix-turn-helix domain-containing protein, partial [Nitrospinae bacterium]|nr:helix-turn-helix domain-containing protein [Nitrospinota bacterium]